MLRRPALRPMLLSAVFLTTSLMTGCAPRSSGDSACIAFRGLYFEEADIAALSRAAREKLAAHNQTIERLCNH